MAGFKGPFLDIALGVSYAESWNSDTKTGGWADAVGDVGIISDKWGPSIGLFQIRSLRRPYAYPFPDSARVASSLRDPLYNATTAYAISKQGTDWTKWSVYRNGTYLPHAGKDYEIKTGHPRAGDWSK